MSKDKFFYIDSSPFANKVIIPFLKLINFNINQLIFKMIDIRDENGELISERTRRLDLFELKQEIRDSEKYKRLIEYINDDQRHRDFILSCILDGYVHNADSMDRVLYLIQVIKKNNKDNNYSSSQLFIKDRPWQEIYQKIGNKNKIIVRVIGKYKPKKIIQHFPRFYFILKFLKYKFIDNKYQRFALKKNNTFVFGRGDINFEADGHHSDYFWYLNSEFPPEKILTEYLTKKEADYLYKHKTIGVKIGLRFKDFFKLSTDEFQGITADNASKKELSQIKHFANRYKSIKTTWQSFFEKYQVKIHLSWDRYNPTQIAIADAIKSVGGVSAIWQMAYDGFPALGARVDCDVKFSFSNISAQIDLAGNSSVKYQVITGYPKTYAKKLLKAQSND